jgi:peptidyl-prolyl cis-trans isomerase A (cyclophilin A)
MRSKTLILLCAAMFAGSCSKNEPPKEAVSKEPAKEAPPKQEKAPDTYKVTFDTSKGPFTVQVHRAWAPIGADRFYELVKAGFFDGDRFFRVIKGFIAQFGLNGDPNINAKWKRMEIVDDPVKQTNARGTLTFATAGPNTRTTQLFINLANNTQLDGMGFAPFGKVIEGMAVVDQLYGGYGEGAPQGNGPDQQLVEARGNQYLEDHFPKLDFIKKATVVE